MSYQVTVADTDVTFECEPGGTVLDAAEVAGWSMPYSCRKGVCDTCAGSLVSGEITSRGGVAVTAPAERVLLCQAKPVGPVTIRPRRITASGPPLRKRFTATVYRTRRLVPTVTVLELRFPIGRRAPFRAGQYLNVQLPDGHTRPYSLANSPEHNDAAELHVRTERGGRFSEGIAAGLRSGDTLEVETPFGDAFATGSDDQPLILLATGTGFAPMKSVILDQVYRRLSRPVHLYWGGRDISDLYLAETARGWERRYDWFRFTPVLSRPRPGYTGRTGWVQHAVLADHPDLSGHQVYACGSQAMTASAATALAAHAGLSDDQFHADAFVPAAEALSPV